MPDKPAADQTTADQATPDKPASDQTAADQATPDKPASDQAKVNPPTPPPPGSPEEEQLRKDSAHLLQLVQELKVEVAKAGSNTLSLAALRKADEIQKLSKSLKERMKEWGLVSQGKGQ
jgi:flagellar motor switch/type III secretory pathway protein FliN